MLIILFICQFFFVSHKTQSDFSPAIRVTVFKFCINPDSCELYSARENQDAEIISFAHLFHAIVMEVCVYTKLLHHTSDSYGRGYVSLAHSAIFKIAAMPIYGKNTFSEPD